MQRLCSVEQPAGKQQVAATFVSNLKREECRDQCRNEANARLCESESSGGGGEGEVAERCQAGSSGYRRTVHRGDSGHGKLIKRYEQARQPFSVGAVLRRSLVAHALQF